MWLRSCGRCPKGWLTYGKGWGLLENIKGVDGHVVNYQATHVMVVTKANRDATWWCTSIRLQT